MKRVALSLVATVLFSLGGGYGMMKYYERRYYRDHGWTR